MGRRKITESKWVRKKLHLELYTEPYTEAKMSEKNLKPKWARQKVT